jgi:hypothetical protein
MLRVSVLLLPWRRLWSSEGACDFVHLQFFSIAKVINDNRCVDIIQQEENRQKICVMSDLLKETQKRLQ